MSSVPTDRSRTSVRDRTVAKIGRLGRFAPLLERAEVRLTQDRDRSAATRWACHAVLRGHGHELHGHAEATDPLSAVDASSRSSNARSSD